MVALIETISLKTPQYGELVANPCASEDNPNKYGYFVKVVTKQYKSKFGLIHKDVLWEFTNKKGRFWRIDPRAFIDDTTPANTKSNVDGRG